MFQRQQATAIVAARFKIVEGAVSMVELALEQLSKKNILVQLDEGKEGGDGQQPHGRALRGKGGDNLY